MAKEKGEVRRALGEPAHEVAIPVLAVRDEHPEPEPVRGDARVQVLPDPVEHLDLESLARDPSRPRGVASDSRSRCSTGSGRDRKSTRLNSSHGYISYAVFCLKKKTE